MAFSIVDGRIVFSANDAVGLWDEATTSYYDGIEFGGREGTGFVGFDIDIETLHNFETGITIPTDVTGIHLGQWIRVTNGGALDTKANGGIRLALRDGSGNESYFFVGGADTYAGGWVYFVADMSGAPNANNGANAVITDAVDFGVGGKCLAKSADDNFQMDLSHYGTGGITITGSADTGTYGEGNSMEEIFDLVDASDLGVIARQAGSYVLKAPIILDTVSFDDADSIIFFEDLPVSSTFYKISLDTTQANDIAFSGFINKTEGDTACELDFSAGVTAFAYDASTALTQGLTTFKSGTYKGNKFVASGGILANAGATLDNFVSDLSDTITLLTTAVLKNSSINKSIGISAVVCEALERVEKNTFISDGSSHAVRLTSVGGGSMNWDNNDTDYDAGVAGSPVIPTNTGNEDIFVDVPTGEVTINVASGATTPSIKSAGATVNVVAGLLTLTFTVKDKETGLGIPDAHIMLQRDDTKATIISGNTNGDGVYTEQVASSYNGVDYVGWARQMDLADIDYVGQDVSGTISSVGADITVSLERE